MRRFFTLLFSCLCVLGLRAQVNGYVVANFDDVCSDLSAIGSWGGLTVDFAAAPAGSLASGNMLVVSVPGNSQGASFTITMDAPIIPSDFVGISMDAQVPEGDALAFIFKLQQTSDPGHNNSLEDWTYQRYSGEGEWQEVHLSFDHILSDADSKTLGYKEENDPNFYDYYSQYDQIEIAPGAWDGAPACTLNLDNIMLVYDWGETGIPVTKAAAFILKTVNGSVSVVNGTGPVSLKVYSTSGQEVASGVNEVQVGTKGIYVVKATNGKASSVSKIVVH